MSKKVIVIAPHPDDETLGCGGTILRHAAEGDKVSWVIMTGMHTENGFSQERVLQRDKEIETVAAKYEFISVHKLGFPTATLDQIPLADLVGALSKVLTTESPEYVYVPFPGDVHTDHRVVFDVAMACTKWFRYPSVRRILAYETISETDFGINPVLDSFKPNVFVDISRFLETKLKIMKLYDGEMGVFPFPRSEESLRALASVRGSMAGCMSAEAFMLLKELL